MMEQVILVTQQGKQIRCLGVDSIYRWGSGTQPSGDNGRPSLLLQIGGRQGGQGDQVTETNHALNFVDICTI